MQHQIPRLWTCMCVDGWLHSVGNFWLSFRPLSPPWHWDVLLAMFFSPVYSIYWPSDLWMSTLGDTMVLQKQSRWGEHHLCECSGRLIEMSHNEPSPSIKTAPERVTWMLTMWERPWARESTDCFSLVRIIMAKSFPGLYFLYLSKKQSKPLLPGLSAGEVPLKYVTISSKALDTITNADL